MLETRFSQKLLSWYFKNKRDLPWRAISNPYFIWLSEIILQQTQVKQGLPYYQKFIKIYPTIEDLAHASEDEVLRLWQGLGYYSRARNMHTTAKYIHTTLKGKFPNNYKDLLKLKGVGEYTAAAIASFAFGESVAVLDGNVFRVLSRVFGIQTPINSPEGVKAFKSLSRALLPQEQVANYNQAIMEFGAVQCTPQKPSCMFCPLQSDCVGFAQNKQKELPVKLKKTKIKERFFYYIVIEYNREIAMRKRIGQGIWEGLYEFYLIEKSESDINIEQLLAADTYLKNVNFEIINISKTYKHLLTHQRIYANFLYLQAENQVLPKDSLSFYSKTAIKTLPKPILINKYLEEYIF